MMFRRRFSARKPPPTQPASTAVDFHEYRLLALGASLKSLIDLVHGQNVSPGNFQPPDLAKKLCDSLESSEKHFLKLIKEHFPRQEYDVFLSHYKVQAGTECQILLSTITASDPTFRVFLDSNELKNLDELPFRVKTSKIFALIMSPHLPEQAQSLERFGPFARHYCIVEIITWFQYQDSIETALVVEVVKPGYLPTVFPLAMEDIERVLSPEGWNEVGRAVGSNDPKTLLLEASRLLSKTVKRIRWAPFFAAESGRESDSGLANVLQAFRMKDVDHKLSRVEVKMPTIVSGQADSGEKAKADDLMNTMSVTIVFAEDCSSEAQLIVDNTEREYMDDVTLYKLSSDVVIDSSRIKQSAFCIVLLSPGLFQDKHALEMIRLAQCSHASLVPLEVSRNGLDKFDFTALPGPNVASAEVVDSFSAMKTILAKPFTPHAATDQVQLQLKSLWGVFGLVSSKQSGPFQLLPSVANPYDVALRKASQFARGTREWVFSQIQDWVEKLLSLSSFETSNNHNAFVIVGTAGLGKSVILAELCRRGCPPFAARFRKAFPCAVEEEKSTLGTSVVAALHFFKHDDSAVNSALACIGSVARQLANQVEGFRGCLETNLAAMKPEDFLRLETLMRRTWLEPARKAVELATKTKLKYLIVLDALDECLEANQFISLIPKLLPEFPANFGFVITTRPELEVQKLDKFEPIQLKKDDAKNREDVATFLRFKLGPSVPPEALQLLEKNADGLFLYAIFACSQLVAEADSSGDTDMLARIARLPTGMGGLYVEYFDTLLKSSFGGDVGLYMAALAPIVASRVPLPVEVWQDLVVSSASCFDQLRASKKSKLGKINIDTAFLAKVRSPLIRLLDFSGGKVALLHKSMDDFLRGSPEAKANHLAVDVDIGHEIIAQLAEESVFSCSRTWEGIGGYSISQLFILVHGLYHLASNSSSAKSLGCATAWLKDFDQLLRLIWAAQVRFSMLIKDIELVLKSLGKGSEDYSLIKYILNIVVLAEQALRCDPRELAGQCLGRVGMEPFDGDQQHVVDGANKWLERARGEGKLNVAVPARLEWSGLQAAGGSLLQIIPHDTSVSCIAMANDGKFFTGCRNQAFGFDANGELQGTIEGHPWGSISSIACTARLFMGSWDTTVQIWDLESGKFLGTLEGHSRVVDSIIVSADGTRVFTASFDKTARIWDLETRELLRTLEDPSDALTSMAVSADGTRVFTGHDKTVRIWDAETGNLLRTLPFPEYANRVALIAVPADGTRIFTVSGDTVRIWDAETGQLLRTLKGHSGGVTSIAVSADGTRAFTGSSDKTARIWDVETGNLVTTLEGHSSSVISIAVFPDGTRVLTGSYDRTVRIWDVETGKSSRTSTDAHSGVVRSVAVSVDGTRVFTASFDKTARIWDMETGKLLRTLKEHSDALTSIAVSTDGTRVFTGSHDKTVRIWDVETGSLLRTLEGHAYAVTSVYVSQDGTKVIADDSWHTRIIWDATSGARLPMDGTLQIDPRFPVRVHSATARLDHSAVGYSPDPNSELLFREGNYVFGVHGNSFTCWKLS